MRKLFTIVLLISVHVCCAQQSKARISAGALLLGPASNLQLWSAGTGLDLLAEWKAIYKIGITADAGYAVLFGRKSLSNYKIVPVRIGLRYYALNDLYISARAGIGFLNIKDVSKITAFSYSLGAGYLVNKKIDIGIGYDGYRNDGSIGLVAFRIGYFFN